MGGDQRRTDRNDDDLNHVRSDNAVFMEGASVGAIVSDDPEDVPIIDFNGDMDMDMDMDEVDLVEVGVVSGSNGRRRTWWNRRERLPGIDEASNDKRTRGEMAKERIAS